VLALMRTMNDRRLQSIALLQARSYAKVPNPPSLTGGAPGLIETSGLGSVGLVRFVGPDKADTVLPPGPSKADIPAIWQIDPSGYANWDGTIRGFARALTSSMAVVGDPTKIDLPLNAKIQDFLGKLPPEPYPFSIDQAARRRGEATYQASCAGCHATPAGRKRDDLVFDVGTDPLRAQAINTLSAQLLAKIVMSICPHAQAECAFGAEGPIVDPSAHRGYVASPLAGVWAVAPYLHNGSVPTLRQLLVPASRTKAAFLRGSTSYNQSDGGWEWEPSKEAELRARGDTALALHDLLQAGFSPSGHGSVENPMLVDGRGKSVRVAWSDNVEDKRVVDDLIAYLLSL
jgi:mono/diheme cytochrome c family protein